MFIVHPDFIILSLLALRVGVPAQLVALLNEAYMVGYLSGIKPREED